MDLDTVLGPDMDMAKDLDPDKAMDTELDPVLDKAADKVAGKVAVLDMVVGKAADKELDPVADMALALELKAQELYREEVPELDLEWAEHREPGDRDRYQDHGAKKAQAPIEPWLQ